MLYLFASSIDTPKKLFTAKFDANVAAGSTLTYRVWTAAAGIEFMDADSGEWQFFIAVRYGTTQSAILNVDTNLITPYWFAHI